MSNINKLYNIWVKNENVISATYGNVSFYTQAKADINTLTTTALGVGCADDPSMNYILDVSGNQRTRGNLDVSGVITSPWLDASLNARAYDASCVHLAGNETIGGTKAFSNDIKTNQISTNTGTNNTFNINSSAAVARFYRMKFELANPNNVNRFEYFPEYGTAADKDNVKIYDIAFRSNKIVLTDVANTEISTTELSYLDGVSSNIQSQLNQKAFDASCVHLTGDETISGLKIFTNDVSMNGIINGGQIISTWLDASLNARALDTSVVHNTGTETISGLKIFINDVSMNGNLNCGPISSTWLDASLNARALDTAVVHTTGNETVAGIKTFTSILNTSDISCNGRLNFPAVNANRKIVLFPINNNDFQTNAIGANTGGIQFMISGSNKQYLFSYGASSTTKVDLLTINNTLASFTTDVSGGFLTASKGANIYRYTTNIIPIGTNIGVNATSATSLGSGIFIGNGAGYSLNSTNSSNNNNVFIGHSVAYAATSNLANNTFIGNNVAPNMLTQNNYNTAIGSLCAQNLKTGNDNNILIGSFILSGDINGTNWDNNIAIGDSALSGDNLVPANYSIFLGNQAGAYNTNTLGVSDNVCIGSGTSINGNYSQSVCIGYNNTIDASNTFFIGDATYIPTTILHKQIAPFRSENSVINAAKTLTFPVYAFYSVNAGATTFSITLPTITANKLGTKIQFRRVGGTTTTIVSFIGNGTQKVYNTALTGGTGAQNLMGSGVYIVKLVALVDGTAGTFAWFQI